MVGPTSADSLLAVDESVGVAKVMIMELDERGEDDTCVVLALTLVVLLLLE